MAPALELGTTPGHGYCGLQAVMLYCGSVLQNQNFSRQKPWIQPICFLLDILRACHTFFARSLSRGASLFVSLCFLLTGTWPKSCLGATSVLNEVFKMCQNFVDHGMPLHTVALFVLLFSAKCVIFCHRRYH